MLYLAMSMKCQNKKQKTIHSLLAVGLIAGVAGFLFVPTARAKPLINQFSKQPRIRVGLYSTEDPIRVQCNRRAKVVKKNGKVIKWVKKGETITLKYNRNKNKYHLDVGDFHKVRKNFFRIIPKKKKSAVCEIVNYENRPAWNPELNDNKFRERLELRYAPETNKTWVVNGLALEHYVRGIGESGNNNDKAYLKSLVTAARTYAAYHKLNPFKHADEPYLLDTTGNDQVYIGYSFEERAPNVVAAAKKTRGRVITYNDEIVVAPYFSRSDGRTRSWSEVWAGSCPWLVSKDDPGCAGMEKRGHGVGMSAEGARYFAEDHNWTWKQILKYYFTDIKIKRAYPKKK